MNEGKNVSRSASSTTRTVLLGLFSALAGIIIGVAAGMMGIWLFPKTPTSLSKKTSAPEQLRYPKKVQLETFQHPGSNRILSEWMCALEGTKFAKFFEGKILKPLVDDVQIRHAAVSGLELGPEQFPDRPELYRAVSDCAAILGIPPPRVFVMESPRAEAYTINMVEPIIVLSSTLIGRIHKPAQWRFIIGREMGHIMARHIKWKTILRGLLHVLASAEGIPDEPKLIPFLPFFKWAREAEITADRAGLICAQDLESAESALIYSALNLDAESTGQLNVDAFLKQRNRNDLSQISESLLYFKQLLHPVPFLADRIEELRKYEKSPAYQQLWEAE